MVCISPLALQLIGYPSGRFVISESHTQAEQSASNFILFELDDENLVVPYMVSRGPEADMPSSADVVGTHAMEIPTELRPFGQAMPPAFVVPVIVLHRSQAT